MGEGIGSRVQTNRGTRGVDKHMNDGRAVFVIWTVPLSLFYSIQQQSRKAYHSGHDEKEIDQGSRTSALTKLLLFRNEDERDGGGLAAGHFGPCCCASPAWSQTKSRGTPHFGTHHQSTPFVGSRIGGNSSPYVLVLCPR